LELIRSIPAGVVGQTFYPVLFAHLDWPGAPVWVHTSVGEIVWGDQTWVGVGHLGGFEIPAEALGGVVASEAVLSLVGVPADLDGYADDLIRGRNVDIYIGALMGRPGEVGGNILTGDPVRLFAGTMDGLDIDASATSNGVDHQARVTVTTGPSARSMATAFHSDEDQRAKFPGDTAGRHLILAVAKAQRLTWPEN